MTLFSLVGPALAALGQVPQELQIADVEALLQRHYPNLSTDRPALLGTLSGSAGCERVSALLRAAYPDAHTVTLIALSGGRPSGLRALALEQLEQVDLGAGSALLYVPPLARPAAVETFQDTVSRLRAPDGCPWDREQTHRSLREGFQEEAYEVLDALDRGDLQALQEELGDVLLHVLMQAQIASESGEFRMSDVVRQVNEKIIYRHPHVFAGLSVAGVEQVLVNWEELKQQEKEAREAAPSMLEGISPAMPALARAQSIQRHVDRTGILSAAVDELRARASGALDDLLRQTDPGTREAILGDLLFEVVNLARKLGVDAEGALRQANARFEARFRARELTIRES